MDTQLVKLDSVDVYNKMYGLPTKHPLIAVVDLKEATRAVNNVTISYGLYDLLLKNGINCSLKYGRRNDDFQEGMVVSFSPGQVVVVNMAQTVLGPDVLGVVFHPDLIYGTPLASKIQSFSFFDYTEMEAKHRLAATTDDVSIIAYDLGFDYPAHFTRMFKRLTGMSPTGFRASVA